MSVELKTTGEKCEKCKEGYLVERVNSLSKNTFIGCSTWPECTFTKRGGENPTLVKAAYSYEEEMEDYDDGYFGGFDYCDGPGSSGWY